MTSGTGVWEPAKPVAITREKLESYVALMAQADASALADAMEAVQVVEDAVLMKQQADAWANASELPDDSLAALIRFFTLAEMQLPGWDGGKQSPVIHLVKILKDRGCFDADLRRWIKKNSDNRYLPYGSAL